ncbi:MAG: hypothetical protein WCY37_01265 [Candidatus Dojkabacteria bacterium]
MKKLSQLTLAFILLFTSFSLSFAQTEEDFEVPEDVEIVEFEDGRTSAPEEEESTDGEGEELDQENTEEETVQEEIIVPQQSFWEVLAAILIPSFFIILVYFILKLFKF